ncbi:MAG TPA: prenyltransferase, partial [Candidatus Saccharimonadales bacterium]|nr:prenyltransferase [Candidatus Saccharimonadales bacterium]
LSWREVLTTSRPFSWINTAFPFLIGMYLAQGRLSWLAVVGTLYFFFPYNLLLYGVNDIFDYESDVRNPRKANTIEGALVAKAKHRQLWRWIGLINLPFLIYFGFSGGAVARLWFGFVIFMAVAYSVKGLRFKEIPLLDSITSSTHFFSPLVYGLLLGGAQILPWPAVTAFVLWGMASHAFGAIQDIVPDRQAGIASVATYFGAAGTTRLSLALYAAVALIPALFYAPVGLLAGLFLSLYAVNVAIFLPYRDDQDSPKYNRGWRNFLWLNWLVGFVLTQVLIAVLGPRFTTSQQLGFWATAFTGTGAAILAATIYNLKAFKPTPAKAAARPSVSVLIPCRNEAGNIGPCLDAVLALDYPDLEIMVLDDRSSDRTAEVVQSYQNQGVKLLSGSPTPPGWLGKPHACYQLAGQAQGEYLLFVDADCRLDPQAVTKLINQVVSQKLDAISAMTADYAVGFWEKLLMPMTTFLLISAQPTSWLLKRLAAAPAFGPFMLFKADFYRQIGGHAAVKGVPAEDLAIAGRAAQAGKYQFIMAP